MHQVGCPNNYVQIKSHVSLDPSTGMLLHEEGTTIYEYQSGQYFLTMGNLPLFCNSKIKKANSKEILIF